MACLPERGMISLFNRSYYEEVLVVRVASHVSPAAEDSGVRLDKPKSIEKLWKQRYREINAFERSLVSNGTQVLKFFLHIRPRSKKLGCSSESKSREKELEVQCSRLGGTQALAAVPGGIRSGTFANEFRWAPW